MKYFFLILKKNVVAGPHTGCLQKVQVWASEPQGSPSTPRCGSNVPSPSKEHCENKALLHVVPLDLIPFFSSVLFIYVKTFSPSSAFLDVSWITFGTHWFPPQLLLWWWGLNWVFISPAILNFCYFDCNLISALILSYTCTIVSLSSLNIPIMLSLKSLSGSV